MIELPPSVPGKMDRAGPERAIIGKAEASPLIIAKQQIRFSGFGEPACRDDHAEIVGDRPKPLVEQPVSVLAERNAIAQFVVPAVRKLVNVRGINNARAADCRQAIAGQCAGVVIRGEDMNSKLGFATDLHGIFGTLVRRVLLDFDVAWNRAVR